MKRTKSIVAAMLCIMLCLCACSARNKEEPENNSQYKIASQSTLSAEYRAMDIELPEEHFIVSQLSANSDTLFVYGYGLDESNSNYSIYIYNSSGAFQDTISVPVYSDGLKSYIMNMYADEDDNIWLLQYFSEYEESNGEIAVSDDIVSWKVTEYSRQGEMLTSFKTGDGSELYTNISVTNGYVLIAGGDGITAFDFNGKKISSLKDPYVVNIVIDDDMAAYVVFNKLGKKQIGLYDIMSGKINSSFEIPEQTNRVVSGKELGYDFALEMAGGLYGINKTEDTLTQIADLTEYSIIHNAKGLYPIGNNSFLVYSAQKIQIFNQAAIDDSLVELTLGTLDSKFLSEMVEKFNAGNSKYRIKILDYSQYNLSENSTEGMLKLSTEIISGKGPDIFDLSSLPILQYERAGILVDLYPYIRNDPQTRDIEFVEPVMQAIESEGKLYKLVPAYSLMTCIGSSIFVEENSLSIENLISLGNDGKNPFYRSISKKEFLELVISTDDPLFIDYKTSTCNFDSEEFLQLLEFINTLPDENEVGYEMTDIMSGEQIISRQYFTNYHAIPQFSYLFNGTMSFAGFPTNSGVGAVVCPYVCLGISQNCADKDGAWEFVKQYLLEDYQNLAAQDRLPLPITKSAFDLLKQKYEKWVEDGGQMWVLDSDGRDDYIQISSNDAIEKMDYLLSIVNTTYNSDEHLTELIWESISPYFSGEKSASDVAATAQSRVSLFLAEQYG